MKKLLILAATLAAFSSLKAQDDAEVTMSLGYESQYVFRGFALANDSMVASMEAKFGDAHLGFWSNQPIVGNFDNEFDFYGGFGFEIAEGINLDLGGTLYYYPETVGNTDTFELYASFGIDTGLDPAITIYYDLDLEAITVEGSVGESWEMDEKTSFDVSAFLGNVNGNGFDYSYFGASADVVKSLSDTASGSIGVRYSDGSWTGLIQDGPQDEIWFGGSISTGW